MTTGARCLYEAWLRIRARQSGPNWKQNMYNKVGKLYVEQG